MSPDRAATILARFTAAHQSLASSLRDLSPQAAVQEPPDAGWSPAQIGCHVAITNEWIAGVLLGTTPMAQPAPPGFTESFAPKAVPAKVKTFPTLEPPAVVSLEAALERLRTSGLKMSKAIASLTPERGSGYCVTLPFGTLSLFELAEFTAAHVTRHQAQLERTAQQV
jgi:hypothetical protein